MGSWVILLNSQLSLKSFYRLDAWWVTVSLTEVIANSNVSPLASHDLRRVMDIIWYLTKRCFILREQFPVTISKVTPFKETGIVSQCEGPCVTGLSGLWTASLLSTGKIFFFFCRMIASRGHARWGTFRHVLRSELLVGLWGGKRRLGSPCADGLTLRTPS